MSVIDIRDKNPAPKIRAITFADDDGTFNATTLYRGVLIDDEVDTDDYDEHGELLKEPVHVMSSEGDVYVEIGCKEDAEGLIKAIELAISEGWWE